MPTNSPQAAIIVAGNLPDIADCSGRLKRFGSKPITLASQTNGDFIALMDLPPGFMPAFWMITSDTSLGSSTLAIGIAGTTAKYRAAATFTATDTPTPFGKAAAMGVKLAAKESIIATIGGANLPASGTMIIEA